MNNRWEIILYKLSVQPDTLSNFMLSVWELLILDSIYYQVFNQSNYKRQLFIHRLGVCINLHLGTYIKRDTIICLLGVFGSTSLKFDRQKAEANMTLNN